MSRLDVVLVVLLITLVLSISAPALQIVREASRARQCASNLRQIGTALTNYHSTFQYYPPACRWERAEMVLDKNMRPARNPDTVKSSRENWVQLLLPFLAETSRVMEFDRLVTVTSDSNEKGRLRPFDRMTCPLDPYNSPSNQYLLEDSDGGKFYFARGNYAINGGPQTNAEQPGYLAFPVASGNVIRSDIAEEFQWWGNGLAGFNKSFSLKEIVNGQSTMVAIDEIRAGIIPEDPRGVWALGQIGSSVTWAHGINSDDYGPNNQLADSDDILEGKAIALKYGMDRFFEERMPFCAHCSYSNQATARSNHEGGVNVLMLDGAVRFISDEISPSLWHVMHSRDTPKDVLQEDFDGRLKGTFPRSSRMASAAGGVSTTDSAVPSSESINSIGMQFKLIPSGEFMMGLPDSNNRWPYPKGAIAHPVKITKPYLLGVYEVTQDEYNRVMEKNPSWHCAGGGGSSVVSEVDTSRFPVENVSWNDAVEFCRKLSALPAEKAAGRYYRLPTEAEWEFACRSGSSEAIPLNADWEHDDGRGEIAGREPHPTNEKMPPTPVGSYQPNAFGLYDMRGNVFEWCDDWFLRDYYSHSPKEDPKGPDSGYLKTVRGWDWTFIGTQCKDFLVTTAPWQKNPYIGFRVVCEQN